ncbi:HD domain-containing protein [Aquihabitans sp. G128]|uniref:HD domain-containing protein n=1 Tax=Aquihabitans sp. G128 TaxID=2849779 RepID=UPI001C236F6F|nr:HD domain-containing protein [Aquihabitans sp. G128]QXC62019.1 HD domain-containing protein [Aquihabitans sp. G128]
MAGAGHLVKRFFGSVLPIGPSASDREWAQAQLLEGEADVWRRMTAVDRRHAAGVARRAEAALGAEATRPVLAAALLHDCGKTVSGLGTYGRVIATLSAKIAGREQAVVWTETRGFTRKVGLYLEHPRLGAELLGLAGSAPLTVAWAAEHHLPAEDWTVPLAVGHALKDADDD